MAKDLVCGMEVDERHAAAAGLVSQHQGQTYCFCSAQCKRQFDQDPQRYNAYDVHPAPPSEAGGHATENYFG